LACARAGALGVPLTCAERITVLSDVARGLAYLHSEVKVIHRDVKSANVLLDRGCASPHPPSAARAKAVTKHK